jgi:hypothetical protein
MTFELIITAALIVAAISGTFAMTLRDGYRRMPSRRA